MAFINTTALFKAIGDQLATLTHNEAPLFERIAFAHEDDLGGALNELYAFGESMCVIVPHQMSNEATDEVTSIHVARQWTIDLYFTGRSYDPTSNIEHFMGLKLAADDSWTIDTTRLGMMDIAEQVISALTGQRFGILVDPLLPGNGVPLAIDGGSDNIRPSFLLPFTCNGGRASFAVT